MACPGALSQKEKANTFFKELKEITWVKNTCLAEDQFSVPITHTGWLTLAYNFRGSDTLFWPDPMGKSDTYKLNELDESDLPAIYQGLPRDTFPRMYQVYIPQLLFSSVPLCSVGGWLCPWQQVIGPSRFGSQSCY